MDRRDLTRRFREGEEAKGRIDLSLDYKTLQRLSSCDAKAL